MHAIRRRGLQALIGSSVAVLLVFGHPVTATADYQADDPSEGTPLDIVEVSSRLVGSPVKIRFTAVFMEPIDVSGRAWVAALMDARNKGRADSALYISVRPSGALKCRLVDGIFVVKRALPVQMDSNTISCQFRRNLIRRDGSPIRWTIRARYLRESAGRAADRAPDQDFFPHV